MKLKINRGTTYAITFNYLKDGVAETLVGATVRFTMKTAEYSTDATDADASVVKNVTNGTSGGVATITLDPADTATLTPGKYYYDSGAGRCVMQSAGPRSDSAGYSGFAGDVDQRRRRNKELML